MTQQQMHNLAEETVRFAFCRFRESRNGKNFETPNLVGCISFVFVSSWFFLYVRRFRVWIRRDLTVYDIVHHRWPCAPKGIRNVDLLGLTLVWLVRTIFFHFYWQLLLLRLCEPHWWHHTVDESVSRICGVVRWFCRLRTNNCTIHAWPRRCPFYRAVVPQLARGWV